MEKLKEISIEKKKLKENIKDLKNEIKITKSEIKELLLLLRKKNKEEEIEFDGFEEILQENLPFCIGLMKLYKIGNKTIINGEPFQIGYRLTHIFASSIKKGKTTIYYCGIEQTKDKKPFFFIKAEDNMEKEYSGECLDKTFETLMNEIKTINNSIMLEDMTGTKFFGLKNNKNSCKGLLSYGNFSRR